MPRAVILPGSWEVSIARSTEDAEVIADLLRSTTRRRPDQVAVRDADGEWTYAEFQDRVQRLAGVLQRAAPEAGDRVAVLLPNTRLFLTCYFAAAWAGKVLVPLNTRGHPEGLRRLLGLSGSRLLLWDAGVGDAGAGLADLVRDELPAREAADPPDQDPGPPQRDPTPVRRDQPAQLYYTSGTTGEPKGVVLTHGNVCHHAAMAIDALGLDHTDVFAHVAPLFHLADAWATFALTQVGGTHHLVERFDAATVLDVLAGPVTLTNLVPTMLGDLVAHPDRRRPYPHLRRILSGGAPIAPSLVRRIMDTFGCEYVQTYGLTETSPFLTMSLLPPALAHLPEEQRQALRCKTGRPLSGVEVRVVDDRGEDVPADGRTVGEILARGPSVTPGYHENPAATAAAFTDGWFRTGDLAVRDEHGFLDIVDRRKDTIKSGGETVYSTEVEHVLAAHPGVREVAVFGVPHPRWGEAVVAAVVPVSGTAVDEAGLLQHARDHLGGPQVPKAFLWQEALPRTGSGKIAKRVLREAYRDWFQDLDQPHG